MDHLLAELVQHGLPIAANARPISIQSHPIPTLPPHDPQGRAWLR